MLTLTQNLFSLSPISDEIQRILATLYFHKEIAFFIIIIFFFLQ